MKIAKQDVTTILSNSNIRDFDKNIINRFISNLECDIFKLQEKFKLADNDKQLIEEVTKNGYRYYIIYRRCGNL